MARTPAFLERKTNSAALPSCGSHFVTTHTDADVSDVKRASERSRPPVVGLVIPIKSRAGHLREVFGRR